MNMLKHEITGRVWGQKKPFKILQKFKDEQGIKCAKCEADFWEGPTQPDETGYYKRVTWIESAGFIDSDGEFHPRKPLTCSFETELAKALR